MASSFEYDSGAVVSDDDDDARVGRTEFVVDLVESGVVSSDDDDHAELVDIVLDSAMDPVFVLDAAVDAVVEFDAGLEFVDSGVDQFVVDRQLVGLDEYDHDDSCMAATDFV